MGEDRRMIFSDNIIKRVNKETPLIVPFNEKLLQPNSYDLTLDENIIVNDIACKLPYEIKKGDFVLASTNECINLPNGICAQVDGKSTLGRKGLVVHQTAGWIDSGFNGNITLEMSCVYKPVLLTKNMEIAQIVFMDSYKCDNVYNGHYQNQKGVTRAWK